MSDERLDLDAIRARLEAATEGPWHKGDFGQVEADGEWLCQFFDKHEEFMPNADTNGYFVAHAPGDMAALIEEVERLRRENADLRGHIELQREQRIFWEGEAAEYKQVLGELVDLETASHHAAKELYAVLDEFEYMGLNGCICCGGTPQSAKPHKDTCIIGNVLAKYAEYEEEAK